MRLRRLRRWWPVLPGVLIVLIIYAAMPGRWTFTVTPETTYVTEPIDGEGIVDYPTALNDRLSRGVTPQNNANVLIMQALGPRPEGAPMPPGYFHWLGIDPPPEQGDYFIDRSKYFDAHLKDRLNGQADKIGDAEEFREPKQQWIERVDRSVRWPWKANDEPDIAAWLKANEKPLALIIEASKRPVYFNPLVSKSADPRSYRLINSLLPSVQKCREVGAALACRAMGRVGEGDFDGAWQDLLACHRLSRLIASKGTLIECLVGVAIDSIATTADIAHVSHARHSSKQVLAWLGDLQKLPPMAPFAEKLDQCERFMMLDSLMCIALDGGRNLEQLANGPSAPRRGSGPWDRLFTHSIDFDPAFRNANQMFDRCAAAARLPDRASRKQEFARIEQDLGQIKQDAVENSPLGKMVMSRASRGELIGKILIGLLLPATAKILDATDRFEQNQRNLQVAFALAAYRADTGRYPARLEELAPKYLPTIPGDLFSGKPLAYRPAEDGYLLYSVGVNGIDEDGRWTDDDPKGDDLRVRMPVKAPPVK